MPCCAALIAEVQHPVAYCSDIDSIHEFLVPSLALSRLFLCLSKFSAGMQVGRLDLPPELLQSGEIVCPYLSSWSLSTVGTGAGAIKSRNNLQRAAQLAA